MIFKSNFTTRAGLAALALSFAAAGAPSVASAQQAGGKPPQGWFKVCTKQEDNDVCIVQNLLTANNGQLVTAVGLITVSGKVNRKVMQVSVPSARMIPPGVQMQIDGGKGVKLDYAICMPDKCVAEAPLSDALIAQLKKGKRGRLHLGQFPARSEPNQDVARRLHRRIRRRTDRAVSA